MDSKQQNSPEYLGQKETADFLHISVSTLIRHKNAGKLKAKQVGRRVLFLKDDVINFIEGKQ